MLPQQPRQSFARAARIAGDDRFAPLAALVRQMVGDLVIDVEVGGALGREIARGETFEVDHRRRRRDIEGSDNMDRTPLRRVPLGFGQIERFGF